MPTITIGGRDGEIVSLGGHAGDYVLTAWVVRVDGVIRLVKAIRFRLTGSYILGLVGCTASQG